MSFGRKTFGRQTFSSWQKRSNTYWQRDIWSTHAVRKRQIEASTGNRSKTVITVSAKCLTVKWFPTKRNGTKIGCMSFDLIPIGEETFGQHVKFKKRLIHAW
jgi:hypothetical protein